MPGQPRPGSYASMPMDTPEERFNKTRNELGSEDATKQADSDKGGLQFFNPALQSRLTKQSQTDSDTLASRAHPAAAGKPSAAVSTSPTDAP